MTISNRFSFAMLAALIADAGKPDGKPLVLTPANITDLQDDITDRKASLKTDEALLARLMGEQFGKTATQRYADEKKDSGKVTAPLDAEFDLAMERKKTVEWDQELLAALAAKIKGAGDDPAVYIVTKTELTVKEASFESWPDDVKEAFLPARSVKVADTKFLVQPKKKAK